jgi:hypothetical protein
MIFCLGTPNIEIEPYLRNDLNGAADGDLVPS